MANTQSSVCCSHRHVAGFLTSLSFLWLWLIQQDLPYNHRELQWNSGHPGLLFPELLLEVPDMPRFALPFGELCRALTTSHSLAMPVCLWSELLVSGSGRRPPAQIQYHRYFSHQSFNQPLLQPFLSEQMWHFHRLTTAVIAWGLWGQSWVNLKCLARQLCRNKFQFQRFILLIYSLSCHSSQAQLYHRSHV